MSPDIGVGRNDVGRNDHRFRFCRAERLKGKREIKEVFNRGRRCGVKTGAKLFVLENGLAWNRICFTFPRKFGNAVQRNRAKRLGREAFRLLKGRLRTGYDMVLLVYPSENSSLSGLSGHKARFEELAAKAGLLTR